MTRKNYFEIPSRIFFPLQWFKWRRRALQNSKLDDFRKIRNLLFTDFRGPKFCLSVTLTTSKSLNSLFWNLHSFMSDERGDSFFPSLHSLLLPRIFSFSSGFHLFKPPSFIFLFKLIKENITVPTLQNEQCLCEASSISMVTWDKKHYNKIQ